LLFKGTAFIVKDDFAARRHVRHVAAVHLFGRDNPPFHDEKAIRKGNVGKIRATLQNGQTLVDNEYVLPLDRGGVRWAEKGIGFGLEGNGAAVKETKIQVGG